MAMDISGPITVKQASQWLRSNRDYAVDTNPELLRATDANRNKYVESNELAHAVNNGDVTLFEHSFKVNKDVTKLSLVEDKPHHLIPTPVIQVGSLVGGLAIMASGKVNPFIGLGVALVGNLYAASRD